MTTPRATRLRALSWSALVLALAFAAYAGAQLWASAPGEARARDEALRGATAAVATFNTLDHRTVDAGLDRWAAAATGPLADQLAEARTGSRARVLEARTTTEGEVVDAAVTDLDVEAGTASVIASVEVTVVPEGGEPAVKRLRFSAEVTRTDAGWLLSRIAQVPTGTA